MTSPKLVHVATIPMTISFFMKGQISFMRDRGFDVQVVASPKPELEAIRSREGVEVHAVPMERGMAPFADLVSLYRLWRLFRRIKPTIVHASTPKAGPLGMLAAFLARVPVKFYTLRGVMIDLRQGWARQILKVMEWIGCHCADQVLAVSGSVADLVIREGLCPQEKIRVLAKGSSNGVDAVNLFNPSLVARDNRTRLRQKYGIPQHALVTGFIGRLVNGKGIVDLASAWRTLRDQREDTFLLIIGPPEAVDPVPEHILNELRQDPRVVMKDFVPKPEMPEHYDIMDVVAFPSRAEGLPNVPLEAAAMRLPVVGTRVTGCVDAIREGRTGMLVSPGDPKAFAAGVKRYLDDPELRKTHGQAAREMVLQEFRPEMIWQAMLREYCSCLGKRGIPLPSSVAAPE